MSQRWYSGIVTRLWSPKGEQRRSRQHAARRITRDRRPSRTLPETGILPFLYELLVVGLVVRLSRKHDRERSGEVLARAIGTLTYQLLLVRHQPGNLLDDLHGDVHLNVQLDGVDITPHVFCLLGRRVVTLDRAVPILHDRVFVHLNLDLINDRHVQAHVHLRHHVVRDAVRLRGIVLSLSVGRLASDEEDGVIEDAAELDLAFNNAADVFLKALHDLEPLHLEEVLANRDEGFFDVVDGCFQPISKDIETLLNALLGYVCDCLSGVRHHAANFRQEAALLLLRLFRLVSFLFLVPVPEVVDGLPHVGHVGGSLDVDIFLVLNRVHDAYLHHFLGHVTADRLTLLRTHWTHLFILLRACPA